MAEPYNPLAKTNLGRSVAEALLLQPVSLLSQITNINGAGVYAIYYVGDFAPYRPIVARNVGGLFQQPIYVGKAVPKGARKGGLTYDASKGHALRDRLRQHANSIGEVRNLKLLDFHFRALVVDDIWIPLGENMMIEEFRPIWNLVIDGFGNKDPGNRRATQYRSQWDVLHPGRVFARKLARSNMKPEDILVKLSEFFAGKPVTLIPKADSVDPGVAEGSE
jgi:hypothetical protein